MSASQSSSSAVAVLRSASTCARWSARLLLYCLAATFGTACGVRGDSLDGASLSATGEGAKVELEVQALLREVFPNLTDDEVAQLSVNLTLEAAIALQAEMARMRVVAGDLSRELSSSASASVERRSTDLASKNDGFPTALEPWRP